MSRPRCTRTRASTVAFVVTFEELQAIFGGQVYFMGYLSDTAVFNHLLDSSYLAAFFEKGLRANTTVNAAMECGCTVITNLDGHSPAGLRTWPTWWTSTSATACPPQESDRIGREGPEGGIGAGMAGTNWSGSCAGGTSQGCIGRSGRRRQR